MSKKPEFLFDFVVRHSWHRISRMYNQKAAEHGMTMSIGFLLMSVDKEGTGKGFDVELMRQISTKVTVPIIASGGMGTISDIHELTAQTEISAIAIANCLHYRKISIKEIKSEIATSGYKVRI